MARKEIVSNQWDMIILDEINYAIKFGVISLEAVLKLLEDKPSALHLVLTGRDVRPEIIDKADLVTEMKEIKHPYKKGIKAQKGIEF
jgi:cob(I)alamin adenosyltransferase